MNKNLMALLLVSTSSHVCAELPDVQEGLWEVRTEANIVGMPMKMPPMVQKQCITQQSMTPENILKDHNCQVNNMDIQSNHVNFSMSCDQQGIVMQGSGQIQYQKTSFSGTFDLTMSSTGESPMGMHTEIKGRYVGKCP